jgi:hypothetical protein
MAVRTTTADINKMFAKLERIDKALESRFRYVGESFVKNARNSGDYADRTGNLRSSIGYLLLKDGKVIEAAFEGAQSEGKQAGQAYASEVASGYNKGYVLIVVAGMSYAAAVESKGRDVLTGSSQKAKTQLAAALKTIGDKIR